MHPPRFCAVGFCDEGVEEFAETEAITNFLWPAQT